MSCSGAYKWTIALLIPLTVAWKIAVPSDPSNDIKDGLEVFLKRNNFAVSATAPMINADLITTDVPIVRATREACSLLIARLNFDGSNRQLIESRLANADRQFVVFKGKLYAQQPVLLTLSSYLWSRFLSELGMALTNSPAIAVASDSPCNAESLPWQDLVW